MKSHDHLFPGGSWHLYFKEKVWGGYRYVAGKNVFIYIYFLVDKTSGRNVVIVSVKKKKKSCFLFFKC